MNNFNKKVAVITGAASGIGRAIAENCIKRKMKVVLVDINAQALSELENEFKKINDNILAVVADVGCYSDVKNLVNKVIETFKEIHLLFNNAGILGPIEPIWASEISDIEKVLQTNLMGVIYAIKEFIPLMLKQNNDCYIVNTASGAGLCTDPCMSSYMASKHALVALSEVLYFDLKEINAKINVSVLCPGLVESQIGDKFIHQPTQWQSVKRLIDYFKTSKKMPASQVAEAVFHAIESNQFYILTHDEDIPYIEKRMKNILIKKNPELC